MKRRVAKVLRRCADRIDPGPRIGNCTMSINVGTKGPVMDRDQLRRMQQEIQQAAFRVG